MGVIQYTKPLLKYGSVGYYLYRFIRDIDKMYQNFGSDRVVTRRKYKKIFGRYPDLDNPQTLSEKIQWLKLYVRHPEQILYADKYLIRDLLVRKFGENVRQYLVPLLFVTDDWTQITMDTLPNEPFIIKSNHASQQNRIIRDKSQINIKYLQQECRLWLSTNYYKHTQEWPYKDIPRRIIIEKLLQTTDGQIPNDYKLHYFNGELEFVYCSIGRESINARNIYDAEWNPLYFSWDSPRKNKEDRRGEEIPPPSSLDLMKQYGEEIARQFDYVRVDFYDVDGHLYFGEVTFYHGGGFDVFSPADYDTIYGNKLCLTQFQK